MSLSPAALPLSPDLMKLLQDGYRAQMRGELDEAAQKYRKILQKAPDAVDAIHLLAMVRGKQERFEESIRLYRDAVKRRPGDAKLWYNLGLILSAAGRLREAGDAYARTVSLDPAMPEVLGLWYVARRPACDWSDHDRLMAAVASSANPATAPAPPFTTLMLNDPTLQLGAARRVFAGLPQAGGAARARRPGPLRIAYLSADFRDHPVTHLVARLLECHDRQRVEVTALSVGPNDHSPFRARIEKAVDHFIDRDGAPLDAIADTVRGGDIDILVDLMGHTGGGPARLFASRLAPVQVSFLGYPGTTGAPEMDYVIADGAILPPEDAATFSEKAVYLPDTYQPCDPTFAVPTPPSRTACGLPEDGVVFCAFNAPAKFDPDMFGLWTDLLREVPGSVLWLLALAGEGEANLVREAQARGIAAERLVFAPRVPVTDHLARLPLADLFLDTFPYTAHTTANDMLRMGVPVVTRTGRTFASRVAASLVTLMGCADTVVQDAASYRTLALELARDAGRREELRARLRAARATSPLYEIDRYRLYLEDAYEGMIARWLAGEAPASFAVPARA